jgi:hypothetical protein
MKEIIEKLIFQYSLDLKIITAIIISTEMFEWCEKENFEKITETKFIYKEIIVTLDANAETGTFYIGYKSKNL